MLCVEQFFVELLVVLYMKINVLWQSVKYNVKKIK